MAKPTKIGNIFDSKEFLESRQTSQRYIKHEFQDFGYRLANDMGDLQHKPIYMKLAKTVDRALLEQAAAFALGYFNEPSKGKLFMWKLSQLRAEQQLKLDKLNYEHDFVMDRMAKVYDRLANVIMGKYQHRFDQNRQEILNQFREHLIQNDLKAGWIFCSRLGVGLEAGLLENSGLKVQGMDISRRWVAKAKRLMQRPHKFISKKNLLENKYKEGLFSGMWIQDLWQLVPLESELKYIQEFKRVLKPGGIIFLEFTEGDENTQGWKEFKIGEDDREIKFTKVSNPTNLLELLVQNGFACIGEVEGGLFLQHV